MSKKVKRAQALNKETVNLDTSLQRTFENRFNCIVCWTPHLQMIYGRCQHRICVSCAYDERLGCVLLKNARCPTCQKDYMFPFAKPIIPEDNIEHQKCLGIMECPNSGCDIHLWQWELEEHCKECPGLTCESDMKENSSLCKTRKLKEHADTNANSQKRVHTTRSRQKSTIFTPPILRSRNK